MSWFPQSHVIEASLGVLVLAVAALLCSPAKSQTLDTSDWSATVIDTGMTDIGENAGLADALSVKLDLDDRVAALQAIQYALEEVGDGATYLWHRKKGELHGFVKPVASYLDDQGRVCRTMKLALTVGEFSREVEGIACRADDKRWVLGR
jgi:surface antigen